MYFAAAAPAKRLVPKRPEGDEEELALSPTLKGLARLGGAREESIVAIEPDADGELVAVLTQSRLSVWSAKPSVEICSISRDHLSTRSLGFNVAVHWRDPLESQNEQQHGALLIQTNTSYLIHCALLYTPQPYQVPTKATASSNEYVPGSGEGTPIPGLELHCTSYLDLHAEGVTAWCATEDFCLVACKEPSQLLCVPWTVFTSNLEQVSLSHDAPKRSRFDGISVYPCADLPWLVNKFTPITHMSHSVDLQLFVFITSDGRGYNVRDSSQDPPPETASTSATSSTHGRSASSASQQTVQGRWRGSCMYGAPSRPALDHRSSSQTSTASTLQRQSSFSSTRSPQKTPNGNSSAVAASRPESPGATVPALSEELKATAVAINARLSLIAIGLADGSVRVYTMSNVNLRSMLSHNCSLRYALKSSASFLTAGAVTSLAWTSDGYALAVGWRHGFSMWSAYGRLTCWALNGCVDVGDMESISAELDPAIQDRFVGGVDRLCWVQGDFELWMLCPPPKEAQNLSVDEQLFVMPFAKSAVAGLHSPDNTQSAFMQLEDRVLVYRGADQPDMSIINPESDVWQSIKLPAQYIAQNWPVRMACISADSRLLAVAGRFGFAHFNSLSGRWKMFDREAEEMAFVVRGGMQWFGPFLVVACETVVGQQYKICIYSRDKPLTSYNVLHEEAFAAPIVLLSIYDSSLLVYTSDNTLTHFLITTTPNGRAALRLCGSIGFEGVIRDPLRVRGMSWLLPPTQHILGDPADDLNVATVIFLIDGKLVLLRPRRAGQAEVKYDLQVLADRIEFYWTHLSGIGTLENSLWGWDGKSIRVWLNALTIDGSSAQPMSALNAAEALSAVKESVSIPLEFYPLSVLMEKGIIVGVTQELMLRKSLGFLMSRNITSSHLFLHHILRFHLTFGQTQEAVLFATFYQHLIYFAHAMEILLHSVLEEEADHLLSRQKTPSLSSSFPKSGSPVKTTSNGYGSSSSAGTPVSSPTLPKVAEFLDHFEESLQIVAGCARKTEIARWQYLFDAVGKPRDLFESCLMAGQLHVASSYLLVLHNLEPSEQSIKDTITLFKHALSAKDWLLSKELLRFLFSLDNTGITLRAALVEADALPEEFAGLNLETLPRPASAPARQAELHQPDKEADDDESPPSPFLSAPRDTLRRTSSAFGNSMGLGLAGGGLWNMKAAGHLGKGP